MINVQPLLSDDVRGQPSGPAGDNWSSNDHLACARFDGSLLCALCSLCPVGGGGRDTSDSGVKHVLCGPPVGPVQPQPARWTSKPVMTHNPSSTLSLRRWPWNSSWYSQSCGSEPCKALASDKVRSHCAPDSTYGCRMSRCPGKAAGRMPGNTRGRRQHPRKAQWRPQKRSGRVSVRGLDGEDTGVGPDPP